VETNDEEDEEEEEDKDKMQTVLHPQQGQPSVQVVAT